MELKKAGGFLDEEVDFHEGIGRDVGPEDAAFSIEDESSVEGLVLEIVVSGVLLEDGLVRIGNEREGNVSFFVVVLGFLQIRDGVGGDGEDREPGLFEVGIAIGHGGELLGAVEAAGAEIEDEDDGLATVIGEGHGLVILVRETEGRGCRRAPVEGAEGVELGAGKEVIGGNVGEAPVFGVAEFLCDGCETGEGRSGDFDFGRERAKVFEAGLPSLVVFFGVIESVDGLGERDGFLVLFLDLFFGSFSGFFVIAVGELTEHGALLGRAFFEGLVGGLEVTVHGGEVAPELGEGVLEAFDLLLMLVCGFFDDGFDFLFVLFLFGGLFTGFILGGVLFVPGLFEGGVDEVDGFAELGLLAEVELSNRDEAEAGEVVLVLLEFFKPG